jgi:hypothetical protein
MLRVLEISWLIIALIGISLGAFKWITECFASAIWFFLFTIIATIFWMVRRKQRIGMGQSGEE